MKNVEYAFFLTAFVATIGALIVTAVNEASFNISLVLLTFALVLITCIYAMRTVDIAKANREMAEEMKEQRYDAVRPILDIRREQGEEDKMPEAIAATEGNTSRGLSCVIHNIGIGPAIDVYSFVNPYEGKRQRHNFGTLAIGDKTNKMNLSLEKEDDQTVLIAFYKDAYGRPFKSSRKVSIDKVIKGGWELGPLEIRPIAESEYDD